MNAQECLDLMKKIQNNVLKFVNNEDKSEENYQNLVDLLDSHKIHENIQNIKLILLFILQISNYHNRKPNFFDKIDKILKYFAEDIRNNFTNNEIFDFFKSNKRLLLFLLSEELLSFDQTIVNQITKEFKDHNYIQYFAPEIKPFLDAKTRIHFKESFKESQLDDFDEKRRKGENDSYICEIIRNDSIDDFISHVTNTQTPLTSDITESIYESNFSLVNSKIQIIDYAVFYGAIQIFNYLQTKDVNFTIQTPIFGAHSNNKEIIDSIIEKRSIMNLEMPFLQDSIKCNHNDIVNYMIEKYKIDDKNSILSNSIQYYNFVFIEKIDQSVFYDLCKYDYCSFVSILMKDKDIDINKEKVFKNKIV